MIQLASGRIVVAQALEGWDASGLKAIASFAAASTGVCAAVFSRSSPALVVVACASGMEVDASAVVKGLLTRFGGRGGGKPQLAEGGGLSGDIAEMVGAAREALSGQADRGHVSTRDEGED